MTPSSALFSPFRAFFSPLLPPSLKASFCVHGGSVPSGVQVESGQETINIFFAPYGRFDPLIKRIQDLNYEITSHQLILDSISSQQLPTNFDSYSFTYLDLKTLSYPSSSSPTKDVQIKLHPPKEEEEFPLPQPFIHKPSPLNQVFFPPTSSEPSLISSPELPPSKLSTPNSIRSNKSTTSPGSQQFVSPTFRGQIQPLVTRGSSRERQADGTESGMEEEEGEGGGKGEGGMRRDDLMNEDSGFLEDSPCFDSVGTRGGLKEVFEIDDEIEIKPKEEEEDEVEKLTPLATADFYTSLIEIESSTINIPDFLAKVKLEGIEGGDKLKELKTGVDGFGAKRKEKKKKLSLASKEVQFKEA